MLQSIAKDKYDADIFRDFGLVIFDKAHHAPSKYFSSFTNLYIGGMKQSKYFSRALPIYILVV